MVTGPIPSNDWSKLGLLLFVGKYTITPHIHCANTHTQAHTKLFQFCLLPFSDPPAHPSPLHYFCALVCVWCVCMLCVHACVQAIQYDYILFLSFYVHVFVDFVKCGVLTFAGLIQRCRNDSYYYLCSILTSDSFSVHKSWTLSLLLFITAPPPPTLCVCGHACVCSLLALYVHVILCVCVCMCVCTCMCACFCHALYENVC